MSSIFKPSFILLAGDIITNPSAQTHIGNEDIEDPGTNPYSDDISVVIDD